MNPRSAKARILKFIHDVLIELLHVERRLEPFSVVS